MENGVLSHRLQDRDLQPTKLGAFFWEQKAGPLLLPQTGWLVQPKDFQLSLWLQALCWPGHTGACVPTA